MNDELYYSGVRAKTFRKKPLLKLLGLPFTAKWPEVSTSVKKRIVAARLADDLESAALWSNIKQFLKRNVCIECKCGRVIKGGRGIRCQSCSRETRFKRVPHPYTQDILQLKDNGLTNLEIATRLEISESKVQDITKK